MEVKILGRIRKVLEGIDASSPGDEEQLSLNGQLEQLVAQGTSPYEEITRLGRAFIVNTATAVASAVAIPTTTGGVSLYNNEPEGGRSYVIDWVAASNAANTGTVACQAQMLGLVGQVREAIPTDAALTIKKLNGTGGSPDTRARTILTATALPATTGLATNWFPIGAGITKNSAVATPGYGLWAAVDGRIIVPPGRYFSLITFSNLATETFQLFISWHERQLFLG